VSEMACRNCGRVFIIPSRRLDVCPVCKTRSLTENWNGLIVIFNPESSILAEKLNLKEAGRYALNIGR